MYLTMYKLRPIFQVRAFSTTQSACLIQKWRQEKGLPLNPNSTGVLTDKADYTYLDGRPTPLGVRQKNRIIKQETIAARIIQYTKEVDFAVERHKMINEKAKAEAESVIKNKLKSKGKVLL